MKRERHVYPTNELCHRWAHGADRDLRNGTLARQNVFTIGDTIYSYGTHFPMGQRLALKTGAVVFLLNPDRYSVTTSSHQSDVRSAIRGNGQDFSLPTRLWQSVTYRALGVDVLDYYQSLADEAMGEATNNRMGYWRRSQACKRAAEAAEDFRMIADVFKFRTKRCVTDPEMPDLTESRRKYDANQERLAEKRREQERLWSEQRRANEEERRAKREELERSLPERMDAWRNGESVSTELFPREAMMRVRLNQIETTMGARVEVDEVRRFIREDLERVKASSGRKDDVACGPYRGAEATEDALVIGCHRFPWDEVKRISELLSE